MSKWCLDHPWMTFFLCFFIITGFYEVVSGDREPLISIKLGQGEETTQ